MIFANNNIKIEAKIKQPGWGARNPYYEVFFGSFSQYIKKIKKV